MTRFIEMTGQELDQLWETLLVIEANRISRDSLPHLLEASAQLQTAANLFPRASE